MEKNVTNEPVRGGAITTDEEWLITSAVGRRLGMSKWAVWRHAKAGRIPLRFYRADIQRWAWRALSQWLLSGGHVDEQTVQEVTHGESTQQQ